MIDAFLFNILNDWTVRFKSKKTKRERKKNETLRT
jgi:hypothetical protein